MFGGCVLACLNSAQASDFVTKRDKMAFGYRFSHDQRPGKGKDLLRVRESVPVFGTIGPEVPALVLACPVDASPSQELIQ